MLIERIGSLSLVELRQSHLVAVIDREAGDVVYFANVRDAREFALEQADLVDGLEAIVH